MDNFKIIYNYYTVVKLRIRKYLDNLNSLFMISWNEFLSDPLSLNHILYLSRKLTYDDCVYKELVSIPKNRFQKLKRKTKKVNEFTPGKGLIKDFDFIFLHKDKKCKF